MFFSNSKTNSWSSVRDLCSRWAQDYNLALKKNKVDTLIMWNKFWKIWQKRGSRLQFTACGNFLKAKCAWICKNTRKCRMRNKWQNSLTLSNGVWPISDHQRPSKCFTLQFHKLSIRYRKLIFKFGFWLKTKGPERSKLLAKVCF